MLLLTWLLPLAPLVVTALPSQRPRDIVKRFGPIKRWRSVHASHDAWWTSTPMIDEDGDIHMSWYLKAENEDRVRETLRRLMTPGDEMFHKWLTHDQAVELTRADPAVAAKVLEFLASYGVPPENIDRWENNRTISFELSPDIANEMLGTTFEMHETRSHPHTGLPTRQLGTREIHLPAQLARHIAMISPGTDFSQWKRHGPSATPDLQDRRIEAEEMKRALSNDELLHQDVLSKWEAHSLVQTAGLPNQPPPTSSLKNCWHVMTPTCLRAMYHLPVNYPTDGVSIATINFRPVNYSATAFSYGAPLLNSKIPASYQPEYHDIPVKGQSQTAITSSGEGDLDLQAVASLVYPMKLYNFLGPNLSGNGVYGALAAIGKQRDGYAYVPRPDVLSMSYGGTETDAQTSEYICSLTDAIIAQGTTCLAASGDAGAQDILVPALCPHWVAVGAVDLKIGNTVTALSVSEEATDGYSYRSGGGFSQEQLPAPSYQTSALASYASQYTDSTYGTYQTFAATPDVSAQGRNFPIYSSNKSPAQGGGFTSTGGTSLSTPVFASVIALLNAQRHAAGQGTIGNPLPAFYANGGLFRDVVEGNNNMDGGAPWPAKSGWDPSTGLGTPLYDKLSVYFSKN